MLEQISKGMRVDIPKEELPASSMIHAYTFRFPSIPPPMSDLATSFSISLTVKVLPDPVWP